MAVGALELDFVQAQYSTKNALDFGEGFVRVSSRQAGKSFLEERFPVHLWLPLIWAKSADNRAHKKREQWTLPGDGFLRRAPAAKGQVRMR
jgi:hypothetical protein